MKSVSRIALWLAMVTASSAKERRQTKYLLTQIVAGAGGVLVHIPLKIFLRISMADEIIYCQYIERRDHEKIKEYKHKGWEISEFDNHHSAHAVLAVKSKFSED